MRSAVDVAALIDQHGVSAFQVRIVAVCFAILIFDGFDAQVIGFVAPALLGALKLERAMLAPIFTAGLVGYGLGSIIFGSLADRFGRKTMLVTSTIVFGVFTLLKASATSVHELAFWQFVAGLGIAGATPNAVALISEYSPTRLRATLTTIALSGFLIGSTIGGLISAFLIPAYGWQSVFYVGGIAPLLMLPLLLMGVPESVRFLLLRGASQVRIGGILRRVAPNFEFGKDTTFVIPERSKGFPIVELFRGGRATTSLALGHDVHDVAGHVFPVELAPGADQQRRSVRSAIGTGQHHVPGRRRCRRVAVGQDDRSLLATSRARHSLCAVCTIHCCNRPQQRIFRGTCCGAVRHRDPSGRANGDQCFRWRRLPDPDEGNWRGLDARDWKNRFDDRSAAGRRDAGAALVS